MKNQATNDQNVRDVTLREGSLMVRIGDNKRFRGAERNFHKWSVCSGTSFAMFVPTTNVTPNFAEQRVAFLLGALLQRRLVPIVGFGVPISGLVRAFARTQTSWQSLFAAAAALAC